MSKLRLQNLGGQLWMQLRRNAEMVPPWDKLLAAPFWRELEFRLIRKRLRDGREMRVLETVDPGVHGGGFTKSGAPKSSRGRKVTGLPHPPILQPKFSKKS
jgi:hypothetical protein